MVLQRLIQRNINQGTKFVLVPCVFSILSVFLTTPAWAEVPVVDINEGEAVTAVQAGDNNGNEEQAFAVSDDTPAVTVGGDPSQLFYQLQQLQQEVLELRGLVEQQNHELQTLKQQRLDDYVDLDRRIAEVQSGNGAGTSAAAAATTAATTTTIAAGTTAPATETEKESYSKAYNLLKERNVEQSILAFRKYIDDYPEGQYTANAYYWLGEIYLLQGELNEAETKFSYLIENYPDHRKAPDAQFKLAKVYYQQDKKEQSKQLAEEVAKGDSQSARLAQTFLDSNF